MALLNLVISSLLVDAVQMVNDGPFNQITKPRTFQHIPFNLSQRLMEWGPRLLQYSDVCVQRLHRFPVSRDIRECPLLRVLQTVLTDSWRRLRGVGFWFEEFGPPL